MAIRKAWALVVAVLAGSAGLSAADAATSHPYAGITLITRSEVTPRKVILHVVQVDLAAPGISFKLTLPGGGRDTVRQTTLDFLKQEHAQVAVNVHFFVPFPSREPNANLVGLAVSEGRVYSPFEPQPVGPGYPNQSYAILPFAPALNIDRSNHVTFLHPDPTDPAHRRALEPVTLWTAFSGSAQIVSHGAKTIPIYAGSPNGLNPSKTFSATNSWYALPKARTAIGVTMDHKSLVILTVDQVSGSRGMTVPEVADLLINDYHVDDALNLDGGGSTTLAIQDPAIQDPATGVGRIVNASGDNPQGRAVGSNLAIFARPLSPSSK